MYITVILSDRHVQKSATEHTKRQIGVHNGEQKRPTCTEDAKREKGGHPFSLFYIAYVLLCCFEALCVLGNLELVKDILDRSIHEYRKIVHCVVDTVIGHT